VKKSTNKAADLNVDTRLFFVTIIFTFFCIYGLSFQIGDLNIRLEKIFTVVCFFLILLLVINNAKFYFVKNSFYLVAWLIIALLSSTLSSNPIPSLRSWLDISLSIVIFFFAQYFKLDKILFARVNHTLWIGLILGGGGVFVAALWLSGLIDATSPVYYFISEDVYSDYFRIQMTLLEPNIYGAVMMVFSLISIAETRSGKLISYLFCILSLSGLLLSFSRGPFLGFAVGIALYLHLTRSKRMFYLSIFLGLAALIIVFIMSYVSSLTGDGESVIVRLSSLYTRIVTIEKAMVDVFESPIIGSGIYSFNFLHPEMLDLVGGSAPWIPMLPLAILHDTGLVGFFLFFYFIFKICHRSYTTIIQKRNIFLASLPFHRMIAWLSAGVAILVSSTFSTAHSMAFFWLVLAIISIIPHSLHKLKISGDNYMDSTVRSNRMNA